MIHHTLTSVRFLPLLASVLGTMLFAPSLVVGNVIYQDTEMLSPGAGVWEKYTGVIYGTGTNSFGYSTSGEGGGNPGSFFFTGITNGQMNGGQANVYFGGEIAGIDESSDFGTFNYSLDVRVVDTSTIASVLNLRPALLFNDGMSSTWDILLYNGSSREVTDTSWDTEVWSGLTLADFSEYDDFFINPVSSASGLTGTFRASFYAEARNPAGAGYINWGIDNVTLTAVPESAATALLFAGAAGFAAALKRRRRVV